MSPVFCYDRVNILEYMSLFTQPTISLGEISRSRIAESEGMNI